jgi:hypothetical protein
MLARLQIVCVVARRLVGAGALAGARADVFHPTLLLVLLQLLLLLLLAYRLMMQLLNPLVQATLPSDQQSSWHVPPFHQRLVLFEAGPIVPHPANACRHRLQR